MLKTLEKDVAAAQCNTARPKAVATALAGLLNEAFQRAAMLRRRIRRADTGTIHHTRIAFKTYRYLCELLSPFLPWMTPRRVCEMHAWQTRMGDIQDMNVLLTQIERAVKRGNVSLKSVKRLHAALARRLAAMVNRFVSTADRLESFRPSFGFESGPKPRKGPAPAQVPQSVSAAATASTETTGTQLTS